MTEPTEGPDLQERAGVVAVYLTPEASGVEPSLSIEIVGRSKRYMRIWLRSPETGVEWGWTLHPTAVQLWKDPDDQAEEPSPVKRGASG